MPPTNGMVRVSARLHFCRNQPLFGCPMMDPDVPMAKSSPACALSEPSLADGDIELLLPWYATGALDAADASRVASALASDPRLARVYATIRREHAAVAAIGETPGTLSPRPMLTLFEAIDADLATSPKPMGDLTRDTSR